MSIEKMTNESWRDLLPGDMMFSSISKTFHFVLAVIRNNHDKENYRTITILRYDRSVVTVRLSERFGNVMDDVSYWLIKNENDLEMVGRQTG